MKTWHWIALAAAGGLAVWYFWPKKPTAQDERVTANPLSAIGGIAAGIAGTVAGAAGGVL